MTPYTQTQHTAKELHQAAKHKEKWLAGGVIDDATVYELKMHDLDCVLFKARRMKQGLRRGALRMRAANSRCMLIEPREGAVKTDGYIVPMFVGVDLAHAEQPY